MIKPEAYHSTRAAAASSANSQSIGRNGLVSERIFSFKKESRDRDKRTGKEKDEDYNIKRGKLKT